MKIRETVNLKVLIMILLLTVLTGCGGTKGKATESVSEGLSETGLPDIESSEQSETYAEFIETLDASDVEALQKIIEEQNAQGAHVLTDLKNSEIYTWDSEGRLIGIRWSYNDLRGTISFENLTALKFLECRYTQLEGLDVSNCVVLSSLDCRSNQLSSLDVSSCTELTWLNCERNKLESLNVNGCTQLSTLYCDHNQLSSLDISECTQLSTLYCDDTVVVTGERPE